MVYRLKFIEFFKRHFCILLITFISLITYFQLISFGIFSSSDWVFEYSEALEKMMDVSIWNSYTFGGVNAMLWRLMGPNNILFGLFGYLGFDSNIADKFLVFWPWIFLSGLSSFLLVREVTKSDIGGFIGFLVLSLNTYFLAINTQGHIFLSTASVYVTFAFLFYIRLLEKSQIHNAIFSALFLFLVGTNDFRMLYIAIWIFFFYFIFSLFRSREGKGVGLRGIFR